METLVPLGVALTLAFLAETITEYFFANWLGRLRLDAKYLRYVSAVIGVALCLAYGVDIMGDVLGLSPRLGAVGQVLSGLMLGRGANYVHDFYSRFGKARGK